MAVVSLTDNQTRTQFFHEAVLRNLKYWQEWLAKTQDTDIESLDSEWNSIVRAILFAFELGGVAWSQTHPLITTFSPYMERRGFWNVWNSLLRRAIQVAELVGDKGAAVNLSALLARLLFQQSRFKQASHYYQQTIRLARQTGERFNEARACSNLGYYYAENGQWYRAEVLCCHALKIFEQIDSDHGRAHTENHLGCLYTRQEQWLKAEQHLRRACAIWQKMDDKHGLMRGYTNLGWLYVETRRPEEALTSLNKALDYAQLTGDELTIGTIYLNIGIAYRLKKEYVAAGTYLRKAETIFQRCSHAFGLAKIQDNLGLLYLEQHDWLAAEFHLKAALLDWRSLASKYNEIQVTLYLAEYELARGNLSQASAELDEAEQLLARYDGANRFLSHRAQLDKLRRSLGETQQTAAKLA
jgi:tetratricopeptide (TPR) repeat protein